MECLIFLGVIIFFVFSPWGDPALDLRARQHQRLLADQRAAREEQQRRAAAREARIQREVDDILNG